MHHTYEEPELTVYLDGDLIAGKVKRLPDEIDTIIQQCRGFHHLTLDIGQVGRIDSMGLDFLFGIMELLNDSGMLFNVSRPSESAMRLFKTLDVVQLLGVETP